MAKRFRVYYDGDTIHPDSYHEIDGCIWNQKNKPTADFICIYDKRQSRSEIKSNVAFECSIGFNSRRNSHAIFLNDLSRNDLNQKIEVCGIYTNSRYGFEIHDPSRDSYGISSDPKYTNGLIFSAHSVGSGGKSSMGIFRVGTILEVCIYKSTKKIEYRYVILTEKGWENYDIDTKEHEVL